MDPVNCLPPEILDLVWCRLSVRDLLASRLVSTDWHASVTSSSVAWRCQMKGELGNDWKGFIEGMKVRKRWEIVEARGFPRSKNFGPSKVWTANDKAVYFTTPDDRLIMVNPSGQIIRTLNNVRLTSIHSGWTGLVLKPECGAIFGTDLIMNATGEIGEGRVEAVSESMVVLSEGSEVTVVTERDRNKIVLEEMKEVTQCVALHGCVVFSYGFPSRHVTLFDSNRSETIHLRSFRVSPMCIPQVTLIPGPNDHFCLLANVNSDRYPFNQVSAFRKNRLIHEETFENLHSVIFTADYFVMLTDSLTVVYDLTNWSLHHVIETSNLRTMRLESFERIFHEETPCRNWFVSRAGDGALIYDASLCKRLSKVALRGVVVKYFYKWVIVDDLITLGVKNIEG